MSFALGLTGSIGMGKSTTAKMFQNRGCGLWDADAAVHRLYAKGGEAVHPIFELFPEAIVNGVVNREILKDIIAKNEAALPQIEKIVHPLVAKDRQTFRSRSDKEILIFDIPLLFETGAAEMMDAVACVYVNAQTQRDRVLARGNMTEDQFTMILAKQMPIEEKLRRSDYQIETDCLTHAQQQVDEILADIRNNHYA